MKRVSVLSNNAFQYIIITFQTAVTSKGDNSNGISLSLTMDTRTLSILRISHPFIVTRCFCEAYTGLPVVRATENQKALNCVVLKYSIPVSEEQQIKEKRETLASGLTC